MGVVHLGLNDQSINYEVAIEKLGQGRQPFMLEIEREQRKASPSQAVIDLCEQRLAEIDALQDELNPKDTATVEKILQSDVAQFLQSLTT